MSTLYSPYVALNEITPAYVKANYLTGLKFCGTDGEELPDSFFITHIADAIAKLEDLTNVDILTRSILSEYHDYRMTDYTQYGFIQLYRVPSQSINEVRAVYPTGQNIQVFPKEWIRQSLYASQLQLVPTSGTLSQVLIGQGTDYLPLIFGGLGYLPQLFEVDYVSGFAPEKIPRMIADAICKMASIEMLEITVRHIESSRYCITEPVCGWFVTIARLFESCV